MNMCCFDVIPYTGTRSSCLNKCHDQLQSNSNLLDRCFKRRLLLTCKSHGNAGFVMLIYVTIFSSYNCKCIQTLVNSRACLISLTFTKCSKSVSIRRTNNSICMKLCVKLKSCNKHYVQRNALIMGLNLSCKHFANIMQLQEICSLKYNTIARILNINFKEQIERLPCCMFIFNVS